MSITSIASDGWNLGVKAGEKKEDAKNGGSFANILASLNEKRFEKPTDVQSKKDAAQDFINYMKKPVAQRMQEAWLKAHGISKEEFEAMSPEKQQALMDQMRQDIEAKIKQETREKLAASGITAQMI